MPVLITSRKSSADRSHAPDDDRNAADGTKISRPVGFRRNFMRDSFNSGRRRRPPRRRQEPDLGKKRHTFNVSLLVEHMNEVGYRTEAIITGRITDQYFGSHREHCRQPG